MRPVVAFAVAAIALGGARIARTAATDARTRTVDEDPYAPSVAAAPFISLGYREATADMLFVRLRGYFGDYGNTGEGVVALCEAIVELDPRFRRAYEYCARAMTMAKTGVDNTIYLRAIALLEKAMDQYPSDYRYPNLAGQIYTQDLVTTVPAERRAWDEKGTLLVESAIRKPGAPSDIAEWAAVMRTKLGENQRAVEGLVEVLLLTTDQSAREALIKRLAKLEHDNADEVAAEIFESRRRFDVAWKRDRPGIPPTCYVLLGPRPGLGFDMADLATGGRDLVTAAAFERLEPVE